MKNIISLLIIIFAVISCNANNNIQNKKSG